MSSSDDIGLQSKLLIWIGSCCGEIADLLATMPRSRLLQLFDALAGAGGNDMGNFVDTWISSVDNTLTTDDDGGYLLILALDEAKNESKLLKDKTLSADDRKDRQKKVVDALKVVGTAFSAFGDDLKGPGKDFSKENVELLLGYYLRSLIEPRSQLLLGVLHLFGVLVPIEDTFTMSRVDFDHLKMLVSSPEKALEHSVGWSEAKTAADFKEKQAIYALSEIFEGIDDHFGTNLDPMFVVHPNTAPEHAAHLGTSIFEMRSEYSQANSAGALVQPGPKPRLLMQTAGLPVNLNSGANNNAAVSGTVGSMEIDQLRAVSMGDWELLILGETAGPDFGNLVLQLEPPFKFDFYDKEKVTPHASVDFGLLFRRTASAGKIIILGQPGASRLTADHFQAGIAASLNLDVPNAALDALGNLDFDFDFSASLEAVMRAEGLHLVLGQDIGFLKHFFSDDAELAMSHLELTWSLKDGLAFDAGKFDVD